MISEDDINRSPRAMHHLLLRMGLLSERPNALHDEASGFNLWDLQVGVENAF